MRLSLIFSLLLSTSLSLLADQGRAQNISIDVHAVPLQQVFKQIEKQTGYLFWCKAALLKKSRPVTITVKNLSLKPALEQLFSSQPYTFEIIGETIVVREKPKAEERKQKENPKVQTVSGTVTDEEGTPLLGATISVRGTSRTASTNAEGNFRFTNIPDNAKLIVSYVGFISQETTAKDGMLITMVKASSNLDEVQVIAYGTSSRRLNTGSVASITAADIAKQPVSNPLAALSGRIPGLVVTQSSGISGSSFNLQIRGRNSLAQGSEPLILIDGIPFAPQNQGINVLSSAITQQSTASLSPFSTINPADIERIDILKDADATAIYGSRGANGVILITTKKGVGGKTKFTVNISQGIMLAPEGMDLMTTEQYLQMRREAFVNSGITPTNDNAPDLTIWDQYRYTNLRKELIGNTGHLTNVQLSLSGGSNVTQFLISGGYNREINVFPGKQPNDRGNGSFSLSHTSINNKFRVTLSGGFAASKNTSNSGDLTYYNFLPPNIPSFFNEDGSLKFIEGGIEYENPYAYLKQPYEAASTNLTSSLNLSYQVADGLSAKVLAGYNQLNSKDFSAQPKSTLTPSNISGSSAAHGTNNFMNWNIEPQLNYKKQLWNGVFDVLLGTTFHQKQNETTYLQLEGFASESLLRSVQAATTIVAKTDAFTDYRYQAAFFRINYNLQDKYILNLTARRDGSSRFGPDHQFSNFGAFGAAWILSKETWFQKITNFLSFAKLHGSYGVTGNDQIGDYQFLDTWEAYHATYQGNSTLHQTGLFNANYSWERNVKLEAAVDLGFFDEKVVLGVNYFHNRSDNQLVAYRLPYLTGFSTITRNLPAIIDNTGWEMNISASIIKKKAFSWSLTGNITIPKNKLVEFPGLETSTYAKQYEIGSPLGVIKGYSSNGINSTTGLYAYNDVNGSNTISTADYIALGQTDPKYYGGLGTNINFAGFELDIFADFRRQTGRNFLNSIYNERFVGGTMINQPTELLNRWTTTNQMGKYEKFTTVAANSVSNFRLSQLAYSDQSFIRLRTVSLAYNLPGKMLKAVGGQQARFYFQGQNLFTSTPTKGYNPETQHLYGLAPLQVFNFGLQFTY